MQATNRERAALTAQGRMIPVFLSAPSGFAPVWMAELANGEIADGDELREIAAELDRMNAGNREERISNCMHPLPGADCPECSR